MFTPNTTCYLRRASKVRDIRGQATYGPRKRTPCAVVKTAGKLMKTSVRADATSTRGRTDEEQGETRLLFPKTVEIGYGDVVEIHGWSLEVVQIWPRLNVIGVLDHFDVRLEPRASL